jgi:hypothetical protein
MAERADGYEHDDATKRRHDRACVPSGLKTDTPRNVGKARLPPANARGLFGKMSVFCRVFVPRASAKRNRDRDCSVTANSPEQASLFLLDTPISLLF